MLDHNGSLRGQPLEKVTVAVNNFVDRRNRCDDHHINANETFQRTQNAILAGVVAEAGDRNLVAQSIVKFAGVAPIRTRDNNAGPIEIVTGLHRLRDRTPIDHLQVRVTAKPEMLADLRKPVPFHLCRHDRCGAKDEYRGRYECPTDPSLAAFKSSRHIVPDERQQKQISGGCPMKEHAGVRPDRNKGKDKDRTCSQTAE
jgi:hypothetical protein